MLAPTNNTDGNVTIVCTHFAKSVTQGQFTPSQWPGTKMECIIALIVAETFLQNGDLEPVGCTAAFYVFLIGVPITWTYELLFRAFAPQYLDDGDFNRWDSVENYQSNLTDGDLLNIESATWPSLVSFVRH